MAASKGKAPAKSGGHHEKKLSKKKSSKKDLHAKGKKKDMPKNKGVVGKRAK
jgi:hypothetical protein